MLKNIEIACTFQKSPYLCIRNSEMKCIRFDSLAQLVEHNTFNVGVLGSSPKRITKRKAKRRQQKDKPYKINILWGFLFYCPWATLTAISFATYIKDAKQRIPIKYPHYRIPNKGIGYLPI